MISTPMMLLLNTEDVRNHEEIRKSIRDIAKIGCDAVCLEFRQSTYNEFDEVGQAAMCVAYDEAKRLGIGFIKIMPHMYSGFLKKHPELKRRHILEKSVILDADPCIIPWDTDSKALPDRLVRGFRVTWNENGLIQCAADETNALTWLAAGNTITVSARNPGSYLLYFSYETTDVDYAGSGAVMQIDDFLAAYEGFALDGFALDEFGAGSREKDIYLGNSSFLEQFRLKYGYDFPDKLNLMNHKSPGTEFSRIRFDYYDLTMEVTYNYQMEAKKRYQAKYGDDIFIGFHHTWWGEGNSGDLWAGNMDYFRLADVLSGGFVDAQYDSERTMLSMTALAESLGKVSGTRRAYNMCWDRFATPSKVDYYHRLLAVRNVKWVGHALSKGIYRDIMADVRRGIYDNLCCPGAFPEEIVDNPHWGDITKAISREHSFERFIHGTPGRAKVAVLYLWESNAYFNNDYMHYHRLSFKALLEKLVMHNIPVDVVPSSVTDLSEYEVIFALWPAMMPPALWEAIKCEIAKGKRVYFMGPPAYVTTDGRDISAEFESLIGKQVDFTSTYMGPHEYPAWDLWFTDKVIPMVTYCSGDYPMECVRENVRYYGYDAPLTESMFDIIDSLREYRTIHSSSVISKLFADGDTQILTVTARWGSKINEKFVFCGNEIEIHNGVLVGIESRGGVITNILSEDNAGILVNGKLYEHRPV